MAHSTSPAKTGLAVLAALWVLTCAFTVWASISITNQASRPSTFTFDVFLVCLMETLVYGYFALPLARSLREWVAAELVPAAGLLVVGYAAITTFFVVCHWLVASLAASPTAYSIALAAGTLLFLVVLGVFVILSAHKTAEDRCVVQSP